MAGAGFKDFTVGEVLTSADVDQYLMQQAVMRFASSAARGSALGTAAGTGVPLAEGMVAYLDDENRIELYNGTSWVAPTVGLGPNVVQTVKTNTFSAAGITTYTDVTGLSVTITPSSATSKVLVVVTSNMSTTASSGGMMARLMRDSTAIFVGDAGGSRTRATYGDYGLAGDNAESWSAMYLDSPATTSAVTYKVQVNQGSASYTIVVNRAGTDSDAATRARTASSITAIEVVA